MGRCARAGHQQPVSPPHSGSGSGVAAASSQQPVVSSQQSEDVAQEAVVITRYLVTCNGPGHDVLPTLATASATDCPVRCHVGEFGDTCFIYSWGRCLLL